MEVTAADQQFLTVLKKDLAVAQSVALLSGPGGVSLSRDLGMQLTLNTSSGPLVVEYRLLADQSCKTSQGKTFPCSNITRQENPQGVPPGALATLTVPVTQFSWCLRRPGDDSDCSSPQFISLLFSALPTGTASTSLFVGVLQLASPVAPPPAAIAFVMSLEGGTDGAGLQRVR